MTDTTLSRMQTITSELERLARFDDLTVEQNIRVDALSAEFSALERGRALDQLRSAANGGNPNLRLEHGSYIGPDDPQDSGSGRSEVRGRAHDVLTRQERSSEHLDRGTLDAVARCVDADPSDRFAQYVAIAGDADYRSAFVKVLRNPSMGQYEWTDAERHAFARSQQLTRAMSLTDTAGGYLIPFDLDPAILLSNAGTSNTSLRSAFTVRTTTSDVWNGITSAGVSASWDAEAAEVSDDAPTLGPVAIPVWKGAAFIPFSIEVGQDAGPGFAAEMAALLADSKERLEAAAFITGTGTGQPTGLVTAAVAASKTVNSATADTYAVADVYAVKAALPARWRGNAAWLANDDIFDRTRQFATGTGPQSAFWADLGQETPAQLLGRPAYESSEMDGTVTAAANNYLLAYGDLKQYIVVDRVGTQIELVPHLFGANRRPTGQRGFYMHFRTGGDLAVPDAVRVLNA